MRNTDACGNPDFVDGVMFGPTEMYITTGNIRGYRADRERLHL